MRYLSIVLLLMFVPAVAFAETRIRPLDTLSSETYANAIEGSAVVRALVERLEASNVIVHIESTRQLPMGIGGTTRFVTSRGGYRYLRITLGTDLSLKTRSAILGHELKHACEVADSSANDADGMRELFENEGHRAGQYFETSAAIRTEMNVLRELRASQSLRAALAGRGLQAQPVAKFDH
jgi:hypothetical protein